MNLNINFDKYLKNLNTSKNLLFLLILFILGIFKSVADEMLITRILGDDQFNTFNFKSFQISYKLCLTLIITLLTTIISGIGFIKENIKLLIKNYI